MYTKAKIYNLALGALLLSRRVIDPETETSNEVKTLNLHWETALYSTLQELDLDSTSEDVSLELLDILSSGPWRYVYKYPSNCIFFRRIDSGQLTDNRNTHIDKEVKVYNGKKSIFTNQVNAVGKIISKNLSLDILNPKAGLAIAYNLAILSSSLITGKGAKTLKKDIMDWYSMAIVEAQKVDHRENFRYEPEWQRSEFVEVRLS